MQQMVRIQVASQLFSSEMAQNQSRAAQKSVPNNRRARMQETAHCQLVFFEGREKDDYFNIVS